MGVAEGRHRVVKIIDRCKQDSRSHNIIINPESGILLDRRLAENIEIHEPVEPVLTLPQET